MFKVAGMHTLCCLSYVYALKQCVWFHLYCTHAIFFLTLFFCVCLSGLWDARGGDEALWGSGVSAVGKREQAGRRERDSYTATSPGYRWLSAKHGHSQGKSYYGLCESNLGKKKITHYSMSVPFNNPELFKAIKIKSVLSLCKYSPGALICG